MPIGRSFSLRLAALLIARPRMILIITGLFILAFVSGLTKIIKDPSVDAFVPSDHPAALARDEAKALFGLEDPILVGIAADNGKSVFSPDALRALRKIEDQVRVLPNVDKTSLISLNTESVIRGNGFELFVDPILESGPVTESSAAAAWENIQDMPMMMGLLASRTGDMISLIVPVEDPNAAEETYHSIKTIAEAAVPDGTYAHIAGVAAMNGRLGVMVNSDTRLFVPLAVLMAAFTVFIALRKGLALAGPLYVIAGSAAIAIGFMGWLDARYYLITTALPVIIMAIAIADSLHISTIYLRIRRQASDISASEALKEALQQTFLPITLTTLTTIAGFAGLALGSPMQPISEFGWFAAIGVGAAWILSLTALPAIIVLSDLKPNANPSSRDKEFLINRCLHWVTDKTYTHALKVAGGLIISISLIAIAATQARFDYERKRYFVADDAVRQADIVMNDRLDGLNFLDVIVSAETENGLMTPKALADINHLQTYLSALPGIEKTSSIVDYIALMHDALNEEKGARLPTAERAPAQYMFLYESSGDPGDFEEEIDYGQQHALIRTHLKTDQFSHLQDLIDTYTDFINGWSEDTGLSARLSGRVAVNDGWMRLLASSHFKGLFLAVGLVFLTSLLVLRHIGSAVLALIPVLSGVLLTYACMGVFGIDIAPATSMTAAISTGLGVDFGIHLITTIREKRAKGLSLYDAFQGKYIAVARACFYSALALTLALCVVCLSSAPPLRWFGVLVATGAVGSMFGAFLILPCALSLSERLPFRVSQKRTLNNA